MVHTIARSAEGPSFQKNSYRMTCVSNSLYIAECSYLIIYSSSNGSSAEHLFYTTLTSMLNHIVQ